MALELKKWINSHVKKFDNVDPMKVYNELFFRDETRPTHINDELMYSPADGIILYQKKVRKDENILEIKGQNYTLTEIIQDKDIPDINYYVIGVFMTLYDVHINRMPTSGLLTYKSLPPIKSKNLPMIFMEKDIFKNKIDFKNGDYDYLFHNERVLNKVLDNSKGLSYYIVQIADVDVNVICPFSVDNPNFYEQCERFSFIRWGSQCDLIVPEHPDYNIEFIQQDMVHVSAGIDPLISIIEKQEEETETK